MLIKSNYGDSIIWAMRLIEVEESFFKLFRIHQQCTSGSMKHSHENTVSISWLFFQMGGGRSVLISTVVSSEVAF